MCICSGAPVQDLLTFAVVDVGRVCGHRQQRLREHRLALRPAVERLGRVGRRVDDVAARLAQRGAHHVHARDQRPGAVRDRLARVIVPHVDDDMRGLVAEPAQLLRRAALAAARQPQHVRTVGAPRWDGAEAAAGGVPSVAPSSRRDWIPYARTAARPHHDVSCSSCAPRVWVATTHLPIMKRWRAVWRKGSCKRKRT